MSKFIQRRRSILKSTLETLEIISPGTWKDVKPRWVNWIMEDMAHKEVISFYEFKAGMSEELEEDLAYIQNNLGGDYLSTYEKIIEKIEEYANSDSFQQILRDIKAEKFSKGRWGDFGETGINDLTKLLDPYKN